MSKKYLNIYRIESSRLQNWDYGWNGWYFVTVKTKFNRPYFGKIVNNKMILSNIGVLAERYWQEIPNHFNFVKLDGFVVMPDHIHGIITINKKDDVETRHCLVSTNNHLKRSLSDIGHYRYRNPGKQNLSSIVGSYKAIVSKMAHKINIDFAWQTRFNDKILWNFDELEFFQTYILNNPTNYKK